MKFVLKLLLGVGVIFGAFFLISELSSPAEGKVEIVQEEEAVDVDVKIVINDEVVVDTKIEEVEEVVEEAVEEVKESFMPLTVGKSLNKFAKKHKTKIVKLSKQEAKYVMSLTKKEVKKGVKVNGDIYFKIGGKNYVIHKGQLSIIN